MDSNDICMCVCVLCLRKDKLIWATYILQSFKDNHCVCQSRCSQTIALWFSIIPKVFLYLINCSSSDKCNSQELLLRLISSDSSPIWKKNFFKGLALSNGFKILSKPKQLHKNFLTNDFFIGFNPLTKKSVWLGFFLLH